MTSCRTRHSHHARALLIVLALAGLPCTAHGIDIVREGQPVAVVAVDAGALPAV